jgi:hypothetical protein
MSKKIPATGFFLYLLLTEKWSIAGIIFKSFVNSEFICFFRFEKEEKGKLSRIE